jgi:hypothetical protein
VTDEGELAIEDVEQWVVITGIGIVDCWGFMRTGETEGMYRKRE